MRMNDIDVDEYVEHPPHPVLEVLRVCAEGENGCSPQPEHIRRLFLLYRTGGTFIGYVLFTSETPSATTYEVSAFLLPAFRNQGYMKRFIHWFYCKTHDQPLVDFVAYVNGRNAPAMSVVQHATEAYNVSIHCQIQTRL